MEAGCGNADKHPMVTRRLVEVGKVVGIEVADHVIIGNGCYVSFLEQKLL